MSKRSQNILLCAVALVVGAVIYILYRDNTYISRWFSYIAFVRSLRTMANGYASNFVGFYLPDLLWGFSLSCGIQAIYLPGRRGVFISATVAFICGVLWEVLQWTDLVSGTGDIWDILMYFAGSVLSTLINIKERKQT